MSIISNKVFYLQDEVTNEHSNYFQSQGLIQFKNFISRDTVKEFIHEIKSVESFLIKHNIQKVNGVPLKFGKDVDGSDIIQRLAFTSKFSDVLSNFLKNGRLQSLARLLHPYEGRISENEKDGLVVNHYINTPDSRAKQLGWHTDSPRDLFIGSRIMPMLNIGLHLDDCPYENGGLRVLSGTHRKGWATLFFKKKYFIDNKPDADETGLDIEAGDLTIHDGRIWHRVQQSPHVGEQSRRRVMYIPIITGAYKPRNANSPTALYHRIGQLTLKPFKQKAKEKQEAFLATENAIVELNPHI